METDLTLLILDGHHGIFQINKVLLLHLLQRKADLLGLELIVIPNHH